MKARRKLGFLVLWLGGSLTSGVSKSTATLPSPPRRAGPGVSEARSPLEPATVLRGHGGQADSPRRTSLTRPSLPREEPAVEGRPRPRPRSPRSHARALFTPGRSEAPGAVDAKAPGQLVAALGSLVAATHATVRLLRVIEGATRPKGMAACLVQPRAPQRGRPPREWLGFFLQR
jgi:hypothetical protein